MSRLFASVFGLLLCGSAFGQVVQSGNVTQNHPVSWVYNGVIGDAGPATNGILSGMGVTANTVTGFCQNSHPITQAYVELCFGVTDSGAQITLQGYGESTPGFTLCINATCTPLPPGGGGGAVLNTRTISTGVSDSAATSDGVILWNSAISGTKTEDLYTCNFGTTGYNIVIKDEYGSASGVAPIEITPTVGNTIDGGSNFFISISRGDTRIVCNGVSNWAVIQ